MNTKVRPSQSEGGWSSSYSSYYRFAHVTHEEFLHQNEKIHLEEMRILKELTTSQLPKEYQQQYVHHEVSNLHNEAYRTATSCHLYACMALEGFLNLYGVRRLGESFYQKNLERLGICEKLALVGACCSQWEIEEHAEVARDFRDLFDARNRLVHPKAREFKPEQV